MNIRPQHFQVFRPLAVLVSCLLAVLPSFPACGQFQYEQIKSFGFTELSGVYPQSKLIEASDGKLYGTTEDGVFQLSTDGSGYRMLRRIVLESEFFGIYYLGLSGVVEGSDGALYGTTAYGGITNENNGFGSGTVFKLKKDGSGFSVLHSFVFSSDGRFPFAGLIEGSDGRLYGTTAYGTNLFSNEGNGTVFRLKKDGSEFSVLHQFNGASAGDGSIPFADLLEGSDGMLYGTTSSGGITNVNDWDGLGTVFRLNKDGSEYKVLYRFGNNGDAAKPEAGLVEGNDGVLYGTTAHGGIRDSGNSSGYGTVFKLNKDGSSYAVLRRFIHSDGQGSNPSAGLVVGSAETLYGTTMSGGTPTDGGVGQGTVFKLNKDGTGHTVLHAFSGRDGDGVGFPRSLLGKASDGALYGATYWGGVMKNNPGFGTVFTLKMDGSDYGVLHRFTESGGDGAFPNASLIVSTDRALYGTTEYGGTQNAGTVFKLDGDGTAYDLLRSFTNAPRGLVEGSDGLLYGTTASGGVTNNVFPYGQGTLFKMRKDGGGFAILRTFTGVEDGDGAGPFASLIEGSDGSLYGTTRNGGTTNANSSSGLGTLFKLNKDGSGYSVFHRFSGGDDGEYPYGSLLEASDGVLYGTTEWKIFRLNRDGSGFRVLSSPGGPHGLLEGSDGALYGVTSYPGGCAGRHCSTSRGNVFRLNRDGSGYSVLHEFDDASPSGPLVEGSDGMLYGTTGNTWCSEGGCFTDPSSIFRLGKDGARCEVLQTFPGKFPRSQFPLGPNLMGLTKGSHGKLYGTTRCNGELGFGTVFVLHLQPVLSRPVISTGGVFLRFTSVPGSTNEIQRAGMFGEGWSVLSNVVAAPSGVGEFTDTTVRQASAYYRVVRER